MIRVLFFAQVKEIAGVAGVDLHETFPDPESIRAHLSAQNDKWALALESGKLLVAINQTIASLDAEVKDGDEVAFFPPVTGG
ncbi:molybdopterin synthase sulfur carrier subunit [Veronia nyctiphanis]|uniref:Molybdopterin synthase sulfur carrier subunit n=1 Tax=Veronia nyctiphanis TaxID=1278244 RepID=A0A4Q0YWH4_9GAMM|nr:molybdopterin synthase sulfur carrier subunit [Veronia nyctiphanis]RXJ73549.1 molybdopterin synthase sulfur carrier subunit [Veronia nyctiphanis]